VDFLPSRAAGVVQAFGRVFFATAPEELPDEPAFLE
jgi:hypothetical protein